MKLVKNILLWILIGFLALIALGTITSIACIPTIIIMLLIAPIAKWQTLIGKYIKGKIKVILIIALVIIMFAVFPQTDAPSNTDTPSETNGFQISEPPATEPHITEPPVTEPPVTEPPVTEPPVTEPPVTEPPVTEPPVTEPPVTEPPATEPHTHSYSAATCTTPQTCTTCGATSGTALGHTWSNATCTAPKTCSVCKTTSGSAAGHTWKNATCTTPKTCTTCKATEGTSSGHSWKDATYATPKTCTACGTTEGSTLEVPGKENYHGHVYTGGESSKRYHYEADCAGKYSHEITWDEVERKGLDPCGTCVLK